MQKKEDNGLVGLKHNMPYQKVYPIINKTFFTIFGNHDRLDKNNNPVCDDVNKCAAKLIEYEDGTFAYLLKESPVYGGFFSFAEMDKNSMGTYARKNDQDLFLPVKKECFNVYLSYLRTRNELFYQEAKRLR